jgi:glycosyltransferase involved in cell wall biosynthesis
MMRLAFAIPGDLATPTGGYAYARRILPHLRNAFDLTVIPLSARFPFPDDEALSQAAAALGGANADVILIDGLAFGALPPALLRDLRVRIAVLLHHPLCLEAGLTPLQAEALKASEREALRFARSVVVTSKATARGVSALFGISAELTVAEPGLDKPQATPRTAPGDPPRILSVGTITPRKGFDVLVEALRMNAGLPWIARFAGATDRAPDTMAALKAQIADAGLAYRITFTGALPEDRLALEYARADVFALASRYEGYGMAFAEAMAHGLPVVASGEGAVRDTVPDSAGFFLQTGDAAAFAAALETLLTDHATWRAKSAGAYDYASRLPSWEDTAATVAQAVRKAAR